MSARRALFLDRDGVVNVDKAYVHKKEDFDFIPGIFDLVRTANALGYLVVVVTNQAGIGRGYYDEQQFLELMAWVRGEFESNNARMDAVYFCPHHPQHGLGRYRRDCDSRKPGPGMFLRAAGELNIDLSASVAIGDRDTDMLAARAAGVPTRLLLRPAESLKEQAGHRALSIAIPDLFSALDYLK